MKSTADGRLVAHEALALKALAPAIRRTARPALGLIGSADDCYVRGHGLALAKERFR
jgi:hypothetical protein